VRTIWGVSYIKRKLQERRAKKEKEGPADKAARVTATATLWIALFTLVLAILSGLTWWEIHTGSADTKALAEAAKKQADSTHDLAVQAKNQADRTKDVADAAKEQAEAAKSQSDDTKILAQAAREQVAKLQA
jgi:methyl-accepting chemotaxis protein